MRAHKTIAVIAALTFLAFPLTAFPTSAAPRESALAASSLSMSGPGNRIHGADISRWQHPGGKPIDFTKMRAAGLDFVIIKASDSRLVIAKAHRHQGYLLAFITMHLFLM
jgi:GH25 family lysozyme M1 (1,4-beta-N-acetylmuramidase)